MGSGAHHHSHENHHHVIPLKTFVNVLIALIILTVITVAASRIDFGALNFFVAMAIATVKASLVMAYFMHLKYDDRLYLWIILMSVFFLFVMFGFSHLDIITRVFQGSTLN